MSRGPASGPAFRKDIQIAGRNVAPTYENQLLLLSMIPAGGVASAVVRKPMVLAQVLQQGMKFGAMYAALSPLWPAASTSLFGSYKGDKYDPYIGFGFEGETAKARRHPLTAPWISRYMGGTPSGRWLGDLQVPTFGFGWESRLRPPITSSSSPDRPQSSQRVRSQGAGASSETSSGYSRPAKRPSRRAQASSRGGNPYCWVHMRRHWCKYTRQ